MPYKLCTPSFAGINLKFFSFSLLIHVIFLFFFLNFSFESTSKVKDVVVVDLRFLEPQLQEDRQGFESVISTQGIENKPKNQKALDSKEGAVAKEFFEQTKVEEKALAESVVQTRDTLSVGVQEERTLVNSEEVSRHSLSSPGGSYSSKTDIRDARGGKGTEGKEKAEGSKGGDVDNYLKTQLSLISTLVRQHLEYPYLARRMGWEGEVVLMFRLTPRGEVEDLRVFKTSGYETLDKSAMMAVQRASKNFPRPYQTVLIKLPVHFRLER